VQYSECVFVVLDIEHAVRMRRITLPSVQYSDTLSHKRRDFRNKIKLPNAKCEISTKAGSYLKLAFRPLGGAVCLLINPAFCYAILGQLYALLRLVPDCGRS
jgi:hypothetical protein